MSTTVLSENIVNMISQLSTLQSRKDEIQERIRHFENKLNMAREASNTLTNEEQGLINQLQTNGFQYAASQLAPLVRGELPIQYQPQQTILQETNEFPSDQLTALLSSLLQQKAPPTSENSGFGGNVYNFPQPTVQAPPVPFSGISPTSGGTPTIRAAPTVSPTSAPGLSIRRIPK